MSYEIRIDNFEGPLDLLLHLIRKNEMEISDIPMAEITSQYLAFLDAMQTLNLDVAGEFLLMAATLVHIKSRMLLPPDGVEEAEEEEADPRAELVRRLLEYQKYKEAGTALDSFPVLGREVFARRFPAPELEGADEGEFAAVGLFELVEALQKLLKGKPEASFHEVSVEQLSVTERINSILELLRGRESIAFDELFPSHPQRQELVVTFLAMLELVKLRMVRLMQNARFGVILLLPAVREEALEERLEIGDEVFGYG
ncbi:segregation and condensation protein A [Desulfuromonas versatilis]|uniref:Segregation and condensation protein A n=1 Tax=Desulfuromonas versatilis TaxID=2802975 RepID=A0ABN6DYG2_9BACT|nr:segregation/condensation protein A [Desulfuromonas versatilis]BCR05161.1 segregation and condensation protein A [Desulfuromonas versatilis]